MYIYKKFNFMSTKIYNAYRLPKNNDILKILKESKNIATDIIKNDFKYLKFIHMILMKKVAEKLQKDPDNFFYKSIKEDNKKGDFDIVSVIDILEKNVLSINKLDYSTLFGCSIFYDNDYWYIKFFPNENIHFEILKTLEKELKKYNFEDYHYQNQTDIPENMSYDDYKNRSKKWDELLNKDGDYMDGLQYEVFGPHEFKKLLTKNYYTGEKDIYKHLAYKFNIVYFKDEK